MQKKCMLPKKYWAPDGEIAPVVDEQYKRNHEECGDTGGHLYVKYTGRGWLFHCHRCGKDFSGFQPRTGRRRPRELEEEAGHQQELPMSLAKAREFPTDFQTSMPLTAVRWLYKYGITKDDIDKYHIGYSYKERRIILPVVSESGLVRWDMRSVLPGQVPRYLSVINPSFSNLFNNMEISNGDTCVIVEDYISGLRVGRQFSSLVLHGSFVSPNIIGHLRRYKKVILWLDADKYETSCRLLRTLSAKCINISVASTEKDPKEYSDEKIKEVVGDVAVKM